MIKPETYNEVVCYAKCMELKKHVPYLTDEKIEDMYNHLSANPDYRIIVSPERIFLTDDKDNTTKSFPTGVNYDEVSFESIIIGAVGFKVMSRYTSSGSSSDGGGSSNNNNNNNNNNNG